jgi:hypothetical protein
VADSQGRLFRFTLTAGNIADITAAHELAAKLPSNGCLISDLTEQMEWCEMRGLMGQRSVVRSIVRAKFERKKKGYGKVHADQISAAACSSAIGSRE